MLEPLKGIQQTHEVPIPSRTCEACGTVISLSHDALNFAWVVGSPGHPDLPPFQCGNGQHWSCSITCWEKVAIACIQEHGKQMLIAMHKEKGLL
jgi:hypothetical protein